MSNDELVRKLEDFKDHLDVGNIFVDPFRWLGGVMLKGLAYILDGLEKVTDEVLLIKKFFQNPEIVAFVDTIRPFLYILLAFSLLYTGYLLIFQKKFDREGIAINLFIALAVVALLGTGMEKASEFTDEAINAIGKQQLYGDEDGTISQNILSRNIYDLTEFDKDGWSNTELDRPNTIPLDMISRISLTEKFDSSRSELNMSSAGKDLSKVQLVWVDDKKDTMKFDQSGLEWNNEYYYRYSLDWITLLTTIVVMAFTLFSIAYKLARLSFEMTFNYVLAIIVAPADIHDGQKTKKILQSILNTFLVIILIFLSMKIYMIGTGFLADQLNGLAYLIALIAFSVAVVDGPNIVERLFGIDAGLKSGWGVLAGAYAGSKMVTGIGRSLANVANKSSNNNSPNASNGSGVSGGSGNGNKPPSPNDSDNENKDKGNNGGSGVSGGFGGSNASSGSHGPDGTDAAGDSKDSEEGKENGSGGSGGSSGGSVAQQAEEQQGKRRNVAKAPSPNDGESVTVGAVQDGPIGSPANTGGGPSEAPTGVQDVVQGSTAGSRANTGGSPSQAQAAVKPSTATPKTTSSSNEVETAKVTDNATVRQDTDVTGIQETVQGSVTGSTANTGGSPAQAPAGGKPKGTTAPKTTSSSNVTETAKVTDTSTVRQDNEVVNEVQEVAGNTTTSTTRKGGNSPKVSTGGNPRGSSTSKTTSGSHTTEKANVTSNSTITTDTEITNNLQGVAGRTSTTQTGGSSGSHGQARVSERKRPRNYSMNSGNDNIIEKMKRHRKQ